MTTGIEETVERSSIVDNEEFVKAKQQLRALIESVEAQRIENAGASVTFQLQVQLDTASSLDLLSEITAYMDEGHGVVLVSGIGDFSITELTTTQAASVLNVSRPYFINLLEKGDIPYRKVGTHRRVSQEDVMKYKRRLAQKRQDALQALSELSEELGLDD